MSHLIERDRVTGKHAIAYAGEVPWHGLGQALTADADMVVWRREAGLNFEALESPVTYSVLKDGVVQSVPFNGRKVLYRSDTLAPLGVVANGYHPHQTDQMLAFFKNLADDHGMQMEVAGALKGGKIVWALAKMSEGLKIVGEDRVRPFVLFATSFDGSLATTCDFTSVRVVCNNTVRMALADLSGKAVKVRHSSELDILALQQKLGLGQSTWDKWVKDAKRMADAALSNELNTGILAAVAARTMPAAQAKNIDLVKESKAYKAMLELFEGAAIGSDLTGGKSAWQLLNSVTEYFDHHRGVSNDSRMTRSWFGDGAASKVLAQDLILEAIA